MKRNPVIVLSLLISVGFGGCSSVQGIRVPVLRPSAVNLTAYEQLAVDKFDGPGASSLAREFAIALRQAKNPATGKAGFQVMDHSEVDRLLDRIRGSRGGADPRGEEVLERWRNVDLLLKGEIARNQVDETSVSRCAGSGRATYMKFPLLATAIALVDLPVSDARGTQRLLSEQIYSSYDRATVDEFFELVERIDPTGNTATGTDDRIEYRGIAVYFKDGRYEKVEAL